MSWLSASHNSYIRSLVSHPPELSMVFPELRTGEYQPLPARGKHDSSLFGFLRTEGSRAAVVAVPRLTTRLDIADRFPLGPATWQDTELELAGLADGRKLRNVFTGASVAASASADNEATIIKASDRFADFPVALLLGE